VKPVGGDDEAGGHDAVLRLDNGFVAAALDASHGTTGPKDHAEITCPPTKRLDENGSADAEPTSSWQHGFGRRAVLLDEANSTKATAARRPDVGEPAEAVERLHRGRKQAFATSLVRREGTPFEDENGELSLGGADGRRQSGRPPAADDDVEGFSHQRTSTSSPQKPGPRESSTP
jgi:hypothetical protein